MSEVGNSRTGALLPTTPILEQTWDHTTTMNGRRLLPSPGPKKDLVESDKARSVRLLLAKHGEQVNHVLQLNSRQQTAITRSNNHNNNNNNNPPDPSSTEELSDDYAVVPGDSFPATGNHLVAISMNDIDEETSEDEQELLKRLGQGQARMEQIKRMLVNQRGFIVQALKQMTEANTANREVREKFVDQIKEQKDAFEQLATEPKECSKCNTLTGRQQDSADDEASMERDRTMGKDSMVNFGMHDSSSEEWPQNSGNNGGNGNKRTCPMCEAAFPTTVTDEDFEMHVMEHFTFEEQETLRYVPQPENGFD